MHGADLSQTVWLCVALLALGGVSGVLSGLFGVGGNALIVSTLYALFGLYGVQEAMRMPLCMGTSLAVIAPTTLASLRGHWRRGAVDFGVLRTWAAPVILGAIGGAAAARFASPLLYKIVFSAICAALAARLLVNRPDLTLSRSLPGPTSMRVYGLGIGLASAVMGLGGGLLANLALSLHGQPIRKSVATAAGVGVLVSVPGALGYMAAGWGRVGLPPMSLGFVSVIPVLILMPVSVFATKWGVALAHRLDRRKLELTLAAYLLANSARFLGPMALGH